jgi:hypothetical protein
MPGLKPGGLLSLTGLEPLSLFLVCPVTGLLSAVVFGDAADDGAEVAGPVTDIVTVDLGAEGVLGQAEHDEWEAAQTSDEARHWALDVVGVMDEAEQEEPGAVLGARALPVLLCGLEQVLTGEWSATITSHHRRQLEFPTTGGSNRWK